MFQSERKYKNHWEGNVKFKPGVHEKQNPDTSLRTHFRDPERTGRGVLDIMHGRSRKVVDTRVSTMPRRSTSARQTLLAPSAKRRKVVGEWHEGLAASH